MLFCVKEISAIEHDGMAQILSGPLQIQLFENLPLSGNDEGIAAFRDGVHVVDISYILENDFGLLHRLRIMDAQRGAFLLKSQA